MIDMNLVETAGLIDGRVRDGDQRFYGASIDSRTVAEGELFVAIRGERFDGHDFVAAAAERGAAAALVEQPVTGLPSVEVADTRAALGQLGHRWRARMSATVVGITGSNGKTTVKEMIAAILTRRGQTLATRGNYNNDLGVPLTLVRLGTEDRFAVIEMGANRPGEIARLAELAEPVVAVVTNAAAAHLEGFGTLEGVARAKGELFATLPGDGVAVINADDNFAPLWRELAGDRRVISFGLTGDADVRASELDDTSFTLHTRGEEARVTLRLPGVHNVSNALAAAACAAALESGIDDVVAGLAQVEIPAGRMQRRTADSGALLLDDSYNANPASLAAGLEVLIELPGEHWLVLGDMGELGPDSGSLHREAGTMVTTAGVNRLYTLGPLAALAAACFDGDARCFYDRDELISGLKRDLHEGVACLIKGSRAMGMEHVVNSLVGAKGS